MDKYSMCQLKKGTKIEMEEHDKSYSEAMKIAKDHLKENKNYYKKKKTVIPGHYTTKKGKRVWVSTYTKYS